jgi:signal transduction histidine kinase
MVLVSDLLKEIKEPWLKHVSQKLGKGEGGRELLLEELDRFYDLLLQAVESGDPGWLKPILIDWSSSRTESDMDSEEITLSPVMSAIVTETITVSREVLKDDQALNLIETLMPLFHYSLEQIARHETLVRIGYISSKLEKVQLELERLDRSKSDFIAVAAHELKTPLTLIEGYSAMLRDQIAELNDSDAPLLLLQGVDNGIRRLGEIIEDMIDVSMIDNNMLALNFQPTWIYRIFNTLKDDFKDHLLERKISLTVHEFPGSDEMIFADTERIQQAFRNVLSNAVKFTPDGGKITVDGRLLSGFVEVLVTDTGIGIAPENQTRIFEKFGGLGDTSLHSSGKIKFKGGGPGLGLLITRGILDAHGGSIWVESDGYDEEKCPGSTFHILIPLRTEPPDEKVAKLFNPDTKDENISEKQ